MINVSPLSWSVIVKTIRVARQIIAVMNREVM